MVKRTDAGEFAESFRPLTAKEESERAKEDDRNRSEAKRNERIARVLRREVGELERALKVALDLGAPRKATPIRVPSSRAIKAACPIFVASDWHVEEPVHASHVNGLNEYSPDIARKRVARFTEGCLWLLDTHRSGATIDEAILAALGDFITGWIHEELMASNAMNPLEATLFAEDLLGGVIDTLLARAKLKRLRVVCTRGNHGRTTKKTYINAAARLSYEWLMYQFLARRFKDDARVEFVVEDGYHTYIQIYDRVARFHHGDAVKYHGGVGGLTIPYLKQIARWNIARRANLDVSGHYHQLIYAGPFVVNGSLIGFNDYAQWIGAQMEPPQQAFILIRPERGVSAFAPIFVT